MPITPTTGPMDWADHTWAEIHEADLGRAVAILPVGAVEAHGPHLPLDTDVVIALAMARAGVVAIAARGRRALVLPPLAYTAAPFADGFAGTISVSKETVTALLLDLARSLTRRGVGALAVANAHLDPEHLGAIAAAVAGARAERLLPIAAPDVSRRRWASRLTEEFRSGACHAGRYEGSIVLAARPGAMREEIARTLPPHPVSLSDAILAGKRSFEEAGGSRAYFGAPAEATAEEGREIIALLGAILCDAVEETLAEGNG